MGISNDKFNIIIFNLKTGKRISDEVIEMLELIKQDESMLQFFLSDFLYKIVESNEYNKEVVRVINDYLLGRITIEMLSYKLFNHGKVGYSELDDLYDKSLIVHDNIKRGLTDYNYPYKNAQFHHFINDETIFEKMIRVLYEFTRNDEPNLRGVCFDYCIFLTALNIIKEKETKFVILNGIERDGSTNWFIINNENDKTVLDPFNGIYTKLKDYKEVKGVVSVIRTDVEYLIDSKSFQFGFYNFKNNKRQ